MGCQISSPHSTLKRMDTKNMLALSTNFRSSPTIIRQEDVVDYISIKEQSSSSMPSPCSSKHFLSASRPVSNYSAASTNRISDETSTRLHDESSINLMHNEKLNKLDETSSKILIDETSEDEDASSPKKPLSLTSPKHLQGDSINSTDLYYDENFPAATSSLNCSNVCWDDVEWLRPHQFCSSPRLFVDGVSKNDVKQGILGDCWLLSACAAVAAHQHLMERVIDPHQELHGPNYNGSVTFYFWRFGDWVPIVIDDRLPTRQGKLIFANCTNDKEFWLPLLEKAFAKMHGSYYALEGGHAEAAFANLTGAIAERLLLHQCTFEHLATIFQHGAFVTCSVRDGSLEDMGLVRDHAYTVTGVTSVTTIHDQTVHLVRLRSPWADDVEWTGQWSDRSDAWSCVGEEEKERCNVHALHDGEFWISFQDFRRQCHELTIATLGPDFDQDGAPDVHRQCEVMKGEWAKNCAGGSRNNLEKFQQNPQYLLKVEEGSDEKPTNFLIGLMQLPNQNASLLPIAFFVYKTELGSERLGAEFFLCVEEEARSGDFTDSWQVVLRISLEAANYVIIPAAFLPDAYAQFLLRVFAVKPFKLDLLNN